MFCFATQLDLSRDQSLFGYGPSCHIYSHAVDMQAEQGSRSFILPTPHRYQQREQYHHQSRSKTWIRRQHHEARTNVGRMTPGLVDHGAYQVSIDNNGAGCLGRMRRCSSLHTDRQMTRTIYGAFVMPCVFQRARLSLTPELCLFRLIMFRIRLEAICA